MSDVSEGPGWWLAADRKWYPPHLHPDSAPTRRADLLLDTPEPDVDAADDIEIIDDEPTEPNRTHELEGGALTILADDVSGDTATDDDTARLEPDEAPNAAVTDDWDEAPNAAVTDDWDEALNAAVTDDLPEQLDLEEPDSLDDLTEQFDLDDDEPFYANGHAEPHAYVYETGDHADLFAPHDDEPVLAAETAVAGSLLFDIDDDTGDTLDLDDDDPSEVIDHVDRLDDDTTVTEDEPETSSSSVRRWLVLAILAGLGVAAVLLGFALLGDDDEPTTAATTTTPPSTTSGGSTEPSTPTPPVTPAPTVTVDPASTSVFDLAAGSCVDAPELSAGLVSELTSTDCDEPHTHEVYSVTNYPTADDAFDADAIAEFAQTHCRDQLIAYTDPELLSSLQFISLEPTAESWESEGDREIVCLLFDPAGPMTSSGAAA